MNLNFPFSFVDWLSFEVRAYKARTGQDILAYRFLEEHLAKRVPVTAPYPGARRKESRSMFYANFNPATLKWLESFGGPLTRTIQDIARGVSAVYVKGPELAAPTTPIGQTRRLRVPKSLREWARQSDYSSSARFLRDVLRGRELATYQPPSEPERTVLISIWLSEPVFVWLRSLGEPSISDAIIRVASGALPPFDRDDPEPRLGRRRGV